MICNANTPKFIGYNCLLFVTSTQVIQGMMGANKELEAKIEEVLNTRGISLHNGLSEVMDS